MTSVIWKRIETTMEQIERIKKMEERLNRSSRVVEKLSAALDDYIETLEDIRALESYYGSEEWKKDFDDEEANRLPKDLERGVVSEDAIWNMLEDHRNLKARMEENRQEMSSIVDEEGKIKKYRLLTEQIRALIEGETDSVAVMANVCAAIHESMGFWWTGFYRVKDGELVLGPFQGPVACMHIGFGKGVCGTAWKEQRTIIVPDVEQFPGHIACSSLSRSEIVVPVFSKDGEVVAVLDIDSKELATFDDIDQEYLERICEMLTIC